MTKQDIEKITDIVHNTIFQFFDVCGDDEEVPISEKDKLLLRVNKAVCKGIRELEQVDESVVEPVDAIDRQAVLDIIYKYEEPCDDRDGRYIDNSDLIVWDIKALPSVTAKPKTGHWITGRSIYHDVEMYRCSECKNWSPYKLEKCPNCHARMVGE